MKKQLPETKYLLNATMLLLCQAILGILANVAPTRGTTSLLYLLSGACMIGAIVFLALAYIREHYD